LKTYAKSSIVNKNGLKYGVIYLPKFYIDFENKDGRDAGKDIALEVSRLKKAGVVLFLTYVMMVVDRCQQLLILLIIH
jgi:hypothetical protein